MILTLLWLTVSTPFVFSFQQEQARQHRSADSKSPISDTEDSKPLSGNTEEKVPNGGSSFSEEYLHEFHINHYFATEVSQYHKCENDGTYIAFHGELLVPPPNLS